MKQLSSLLGTAPPVDAYNVLKVIGNLSIGADSDQHYDAEQLYS
ncbi:hypothetical protein [Arthrobacter sunyaminii]|nr:hypothetical protein [Arthrobacter sunyaminii]